MNAHQTGFTPEEIYRRHGLGPAVLNREEFLAYANLKLEALGQPGFRGGEGATGVSRVAEPFLRSLQARTRLGAIPLPPVDQRIQDFLDGFAAEVGEEAPPLPRETFLLDRHGLARTLSLPADSDRYASPVSTSYRVAQGVLHNPLSDRRTTAGVFHVTDWGLPVPGEKKAVPPSAAARILHAALHPPREFLEMPLTSGQEEKAYAWTSLLLRPTVRPEVPGVSPRQSMEIRFFAPPMLVSNLDFVESIFGNAGDPYLADNDAGLDIEGWTGQTGCVILAPHISKLRKRDLGLPHASEATERQRRDGMCWENEDEVYNDGGAFKLTLRSADGVMVTAISDSYFGYSKKEVKTQISFAANLCGQAEEEHAGGALVFPSYDLGEEFVPGPAQNREGITFADNRSFLAGVAEVRPEGYAVDRRDPSVIYLPERVFIGLDEQVVRWGPEESPHELRLRPDAVYVLPSGYRVRMVKPAEGRRWRLRGTAPEGTFCHKPCTVSGGGKSEISKSLDDAILTGPVFVADLAADLARVREILAKEYGNRFRDPARRREQGRPILSPERSLGSVIKLLTPSPEEYTDAYNEWLLTIPQHVKDLVLVVKRFHKDDWEEDWWNRFSVDSIDGVAGNELRYHNQKLVTQYLRVGYTPDGSWRTFGLRKDFLPAAKISREDDISASTVVPAEWIRGAPPFPAAKALKFVENCEFRFFQRPDDAIIRGYDKQAEADLASADTFASNYQPLTREEVREQVGDTIRFEKYTDPMRERLQSFAAGDGPDYCVSSANPRIVDGVRTKNPRYLQLRPDWQEPREIFLAEICARLRRRLGPEDPVPFPVQAVLPGHRNNAADPANGIRALCPFNPIHYFELPELFMELIASLTGRSPSTTGAGSEGALTKGPFNALPPVHDLNNALVSYLLTEAPVFLTSAGTIGPNRPVAHDISLLVPEVWARLEPEERDPAYLIREGYLEKLADFDHGGETIRASRLGYRITSRFVRFLLGRIFHNPTAVFPEEFLEPERQDREAWVDSIRNIQEAQQWVARLYFEDGSIEQACPPLRRLLHVMAEGHWEGRGIDDPELRALFTRDALLGSDWYRQRLENQATRDRDHVARQARYLAETRHYRERRYGLDEATLRQKEEALAARRKRVEDPGYPSSLFGTLGCDIPPQTREAHG